VPCLGVELRQCTSDAKEEFFFTSIEYYEVELPVAIVRMVPACGILLAVCHYIAPRLRNFIESFSACESKPFQDLYRALQSLKVEIHNTDDGLSE
jgi:hypothetical protein